MEKFTDSLLVESFGDDGKWLLKRGFSFYYLDKTGKRIDLIIPEGFVTDFASTPTLLYSIFPPIGIYNKAAIVHDYLYTAAILTRKESDLFFLQAMEVLEVPRWKRRLMFAAVRIFGAKRFGQ